MLRIETKKENKRKFSYLFQCCILVASFIRVYIQFIVVEELFVLLTRCVFHFFQRDLSPFLFFAPVSWQPASQHRASFFSFSNTASRVSFPRIVSSDDFRVERCPSIRFHSFEKRKHTAHGPIEESLSNTQQAFTVCRAFMEVKCPADF